MTKAVQLSSVGLANGVATLDSNSRLTTAQFPAVSGDITISAGSTTATLANSGVTAGTYNDVSTQVRPFTVDAKGRITSVGTSVTITPAWASITSKPTTISGYGITDAITTVGGQSISGSLTISSLSIDGTVYRDTATITTTQTTQTVLITLAAASYGQIKAVIQATRGTIRQSSEILIVHDGTTAYATEYGSIQTGVKLYTIDADISTGNLRCLTTSTSATSTVYKVTYTAITA